MFVPWCVLCPAKAVQTGRSPTSASMQAGEGAKHRPTENDLHQLVLGVMVLRMLQGQGDSALDTLWKKKAETVGQQ